MLNVTQVELEVEVTLDNRNTKNMKKWKNEKYEKYEKYEKKEKNEKYEKYDDKLELSSAKLSRFRFGCLEVIFEVVSKDNLKSS